MEAPFALAALFTGLGGLLTGWSGLKRAKHESVSGCEEHLKAARMESEAMASDFHAYRMRHPE